MVAYEVKGIEARSEMGGMNYKRILTDIPAADVVPVVHGRWVPIVSYNNTYKCSECGRLLVNITDGLSMVAKHYPYCHCGAKMDEVNQWLMEYIRKHDAKDIARKGF